MSKIEIIPPVALTVIVAAALFAASCFTITQEPVKAAGIQQKPETVITETASEITGLGKEDNPTVALRGEQPEEEPEEETEVYSLDLSGDECEMLLKIAMAEAEGESVEGKALVMCTVLNRVWNEGFPDDIWSVLTQDTPVIQFTTMAEGGRYWTTEPDEGCYEALNMVLHGWDESRGALYFEASSNSKDSWQAVTLEFLFEVGNQKYYK